MSHLMCYTMTMNEEFDENEILMRRLLEKVCEGVEVPSDNESEEAYDLQNEENQKSER